MSLYILSLAAPISAWAEESEDEWNNNVELGAVKTNGNTQTLTLNSAAKLVHNGKVLRSTITGSANNATNNNATTAEKYAASLQEDWKITEADYLFVRLGFESDRFAGFRRRYSETIGYGRDLIKTDHFSWNIELGGGLRQSQFTDRSKKNEAIARSASNMSWDISESAKLTQDLSTEGGKSGWASKSVTGLQHKLNSSLSSKISLKLDHNSKVPAGTKKLDIETAITLVVNF
ncbi:DUF481 domain-containing protein [Mariprofundus micogutta]|nr:DUF481 domain-containing protein [Mariprofundus micogutta]